MNKNKIFFITFICVVLFLGFFLIKAQEKKMAIQTGSQTKQNDAVITEGAQEQAKQESYTSGITLHIAQPQANATVTSSSLVVKGTTSPNADVFVNDSELKADTSGNFSTTITLDEGENAIIIVVNDSEGNSAEEQLLVTLQ
jgi:hypothetical protein